MNHYVLYYSGIRHVLRKNKVLGIRRALEFEAEGVTRRGRPQLGWREQVEKAGLRDDEARNRCEWPHGVFGFHHK